MRRTANILAVAFCATSLLAAQPPNIPGDHANKPEKRPTARPEKGRTQNTSAVRATASNHAKTQKPYQVGRASWYGKQFHGRETASGEPYDMFQFTAAHRRLPLGTLVKVTNLHNGRAVVVRVNDRGPVPKTRIIDLSYGAARMLHLKADGVQMVRLDVIQAPATLAMNHGTTGMP